MNEKIDWDKVTLEPVEGEKIAEVAGEVVEKASIEAQEGEVTPEILAGNVEQLQANIAKIDEVPKGVLESPEGQEETKSLGSHIAERVKGMGQGITERLAKLDSWEAKNTFLKYAAGAGISMLVGPALIQWARSQYPEVGVMLDTAPDALQQLIHFDAWAHVANFFTDNSVETIWKGGTVEAGNMLADLSSGRLDISALTPDQMDVLHGSIGDSADLIKKVAESGNRWFPNAVERAQHLAQGDSVIPAMLKGLGNSSLFASVAIPAGGLLSKVLEIRDRKSEKNK